MYRKVILSMLMGCAFAGAAHGLSTDFLISRNSSAATPLDIKVDIAKGCLTKGKANNLHKVNKTEFTITDPQGDFVKYESSCMFDAGGAPQFDSGFVRTICYGEGADLYINNFYSPTTYVKGCFSDEDRTIIEIPSGQMVGETYEGPVYFGCACIGGDGNLGLMESALLRVEPSGHIVSPDFDYWGTQYFVIYDDLGQVWHLEQNLNLWELDDTLVTVPDNAVKSRYMYSYEYAATGYAGSPIVVDITIDSDDVYVQNIIPYCDGVAKGTMKNGNLVIPSGQLLGLLGNYTERMFATKNGKEQKNLILYGDQKNDAYAMAEDVTIYGGPSLDVPGYLNGFKGCRLEAYEAPLVNPSAPVNCRWIEGFDRTFFFNVDGKGENGEDLYRQWVSLELYVDGKPFTFTVDDYEGSLLKDYDRLPLTLVRTYIENDELLYWGNMSGDEENLYSILLPKDFSYETLEVRTVYTVDGVDFFSPFVGVPKGIGPDEPAETVRCLLVEEFTTEKCSNCPNAAEKLANALADMSEEEKENIAIVCHHSGFYTDDYTLPCDEEMLWFYNSTSTYAPAMMTDRKASGDTATPVFTFPSSWQLLKGKLRNALSAAPGSSIKQKGELSDGTLTLNVSGSLEGLSASDMYRVTVYVTENGIPALYQAGAKEFTHNHVIRAYNATFGEAPEWEGDNWIYTCTLPVSTDNISEMEVVTLISKYNPNDCTDCAVLNTTKSPLSSFGTSGIIMNSSEEVVAIDWFDLSGRRVNPSKGIYLKSETLGDGSVRKSKVML